jgi:hypothetical protein
VLSSNLGWDISYSDRGSSWFSSIPTGMCWHSTLIRPWPHPSKSFPIHLSFYHSTLYSLATNSALNQWFSTGAIWPPRRPCRISEGPQVKVVKLGAMETVKWATKSSPLK